MHVNYIAFLTAVTSVCAIYPYFDTQDFIYNVPKVYRVSIALDKLLDYYERKPSKDPEWYIALGTARGQLEYTINELDQSTPVKLKENLQNITRRMDRIRNNTNYSNLIYRSKDYEYVIKTIFENINVLSSVLEPITLGTVGTQKPYRFSFEQYIQEARTKMPTRKAAGRKCTISCTVVNRGDVQQLWHPRDSHLKTAEFPPRSAQRLVKLTQFIVTSIDACTMQLLISAMESQTTISEGACEVTPECSAQLIKGSGLAFQQTSRLRAGMLAKLFDCLEGLDLQAHIYKLCIQIYKETKSLEAWNHPPGTRTLFMQQILYCSSQGYGEFIKPRWMNRILAWQEPKGCYADDRQLFVKLTGFVGPSNSPSLKEREEQYRVKKAASSDGGSCNSLTSAMALGSLVVYIRALLETDQAFQYDVLV